MFRVTYPEGSQAPWPLTWIAGGQFALVIGLSCIILRQVFHLGGLEEEISARLLQSSFLVLGVALLLQQWRGPGIGCGLFLPSVYAVAFLRAGIVALQDGGAPLLVGMMVTAALMQWGMSYLQPFFSRLFPPLIGSIIVLIIGLDAGSIGIEGMFALSGPDVPGHLDHWHYALPGVFSIFFMIVFSRFGQGAWRAGSIAAGVLMGCLFAWLIDPSSMQPLVRATEVSPIGVVPLIWEGVSWKLELLIAFAVAAAASNIETIRALEDAHALSRMDAFSASPESQKGALRANSLSNLLAGLFGLGGLAGAPGRIVLCQTMGIATRRMGLIAAGVLILVSFLPILGRIVVAIPAPVVGAFFVYMGALLIGSGIRGLLTLRLDLRRCLLLGISLVAALCVLLFPATATELPRWLAPFFRTMLGAGLTVAMLLQFLLRVQPAKQAILSIEIGAWEGVEEDLLHHLISWKVEPSIGERVQKDLHSIHTILTPLDPKEMALFISYDRGFLELQLEFQGPSGSLSADWQADHIALQQKRDRQKVTFEYQTSSL